MQKVMVIGTDQSQGQYIAELVGGEVELKFVSSPPCEEEQIAEVISDFHPERVYVRNSLEKGLLDGPALSRNLKRRFPEVEFIPFGNYPFR